MSSKILNLTDPPNSWRGMLLNAGIMAGQAFFTTLASTNIIGIRADPVTHLAAAGIAAGLTFFTSLAIQRGLTKES